MAGSPDAMRTRIEAYPWPPQRGGVEVVRANKGYTLYSQRTGGPVARLRLAGQGDKVQSCGGDATPGATRALSAARSCRSTKPLSLSPARAFSGSTPHDERVTAPAESS
jgi:hypothetical protein